MRDLCEAPDPAAAARAAPGERLAPLAEILANTPPDARDPAKPWLLAPIDLQAIKAAGVTFATSMIERVIEERARGESAAAAAIRAEMTRLVGADLSTLEPGSPARDALEGRADRRRRLVAISRGRHRAGRGNLHQEPADVRRRRGRRRRFPRRVGLEQSGARSRARDQLERRDRRRDARQRRQFARFRRTIGAAAGQGQGPERELRRRPVPALVRRDVRPRRRARRRGEFARRRRGRLSVSRAAPRWRGSVAIPPTSSAS